MPADSGAPRLAGRHHRAPGGAGRPGAVERRRPRRLHPEHRLDRHDLLAHPARRRRARAAGDVPGGERSSGGWSAAAGRLAYASVRRAQRRVGDGGQDPLAGCLGSSAMNVRHDVGCRHGHVTESAPRTLVTDTVTHPASASELLVRPKGGNHPFSTSLGGGWFGGLRSGARGRAFTHPLGGFPAPGPCAFK